MRQWLPRWMTIILVVFLLLIGWRVLTLGLADHYAREQPFRALTWRPDHPGALVAAAESEAAVPGAAVHAASLARRALRGNPLEGRAYRVLGQLAERFGKTTKAVELYELAAKRSPRDIQTHLWLEQHYLSQGQLVEGLRHTDLMLRIEPRISEREFPILAAMAGFPPAQRSLAAVLESGPPWRQPFLVYLSRKARDSTAVAPFITFLRESKVGLAAPELSAWLDRLIADRRWGEAYLTWVSELSSLEQAELTNVFNGGFEREPSNAGFDWRVGRVAGAYLERLPTPGAGGELALLAGFDDRRVPFKHLRQLLALPPGAYRLQVRARTDGLRSERGLVWSVACAEPEKKLGSTDPVRGISPWRTLGVDFVVPPTDCGGQWLVLEIPARIRAEQRIGGRAWFDDLQITRVPPH